MHKQIIGRSTTGHPVTIDIDRLVSTRMLIQANSGGGKSWMLRLLCERIGRTVPLIVLDWEGEFASLREELDVLLVGRDGEIPTQIATAGALATQILEIGVSAVIDLYDLNPQEKRAYVRRFLESMMAVPKRLWRPYMVVVDEAHSLAPENGEAESADAVKSLASAGRKRQFCAVLATQRLSKLHKDAAAECNNVLIGRTTLDVDQKRAGDVLGMSKQEYVALRGLREGWFYGFGPALSFDGVQQFHSETVKTSHGSQPGVNAKPPEPSARMRGVVEKLKDLAERSKTEVLDLDAARATIRELRGKINQLERAKPVPIDRKALEAAEEDGYQRALAQCKDYQSTVMKIIDGARDEIDKFGPLIPRKDGSSGVLRKPIEAEQLKINPTKLRAVTALNERHEVHVPKSVSSPRHERILKAVHLCHSMGYDEPSREQVAFWCGLSPKSGNFNNLLGALRSMGRIDYPSAGTIQAKDLPDIKPDQESAYHSAMGALAPRLRKLIDELIDIGDECPRGMLAERVGLQVTSGNFNNLLGSLRSAGLITYPSVGMVTLARWLADVAKVA
jgi:hypothetical protein